MTQTRLLQTEKILKRYLLGVVDEVTFEGKVPRTVMARALPLDSKEWKGKGFHPCHENYSRKLLAGFILHPIVFRTDCS